jgi:phage-related protein
MNANQGYAESFNTIVASLKKAFQQMVEVFALVMTKVYDFVTAMHKWRSSLTISEDQQGIMMLVPALTLLLSPLAIGIGLWAGLQAAFSSIWILIGPLATGLAAMSSTVWIVATAIVGLVDGITYLWNTNETFRNAVLVAWEAIKLVISTAIEYSFRIPTQKCLRLNASRPTVFSVGVVII